MMQLRLTTGGFSFTDPRHCSVNDPTHSTCFLDASNMDGFYESSPLTYSQFVPHDTAALVELQGGADKFIERLDFIIDEVSAFLRAKECEAYGYCRVTST